MKTIIAFDFSINKPAMCIFHNNKLDFYTWPLNIDKKSMDILKLCDIHVYNRELQPINKKQYDSNSLVYEHVKRCSELVNIIINDIMNFIKNNNINKNDIIISSEGLSYGSNGDATLNLAAYKQSLLIKLYENGLTNIKTYSPITIKSTAGKSKKGEGTKISMIDAIKNEEKIHKFIEILSTDDSLLKKKTSYIQTVDDLVDSYWCLKTTIKKENLY